MAMEEEEYADLFPRRQPPDQKSTDEEGSCDKSSTRGSTDSDKSVEVRSSSDSDKSKWSVDWMILEHEDRISTESDDLLKRSDDQSMMTTGEEEEEDCAIMKLGTKRKAAIEEEEDEDSEEYDSSDDDFYYESDVSEEEEEKLCEEKVELAGSDGQPITDDEILQWMNQDTRSPEEKRKILPKLRRYLASIEESGGYYCIDYPGYVSGVTQFVPKQSVIDRRERYPEGYNHLMYMGHLALKHYNQKKGANFSIDAVEKVMISRTKGTIYYLTLTATSGLTTKTFLADVWDNTIDIEMEVLCCRLKSSSTAEEERVEESNKSTSEEEEAWSEKSVEEDADKYIGGNERSNLVTQISRIKAMSDLEMLELIRKCKSTAGKDQEKLMLKVHKYLTSILQSKGFKCANFPGRIPGITIVIPRQKIIDRMSYLVESYDQLDLMANLALDYYIKNKGVELELKVKSVQTANLWRETDCCYTYYITFTSWDLLRCEEYQTVLEAEVQDMQRLINVISCRPASVM